MTRWEYKWRRFNDITPRIDATEETIALGEMGWELVQWDERPAGFNHVTVSLIFKRPLTHDASAPPEKTDGPPS